MSKDNVLNVLQESDEKRDRFLAAWKKGVAFIGPELFGPGTLDNAKDKKELSPLQDQVEKSLHRGKLRRRTVSCSNGQLL